MHKNEQEVARVKEQSKPESDSTCLGSYSTDITKALDRVKQRERSLAPYVRTTARKVRKDARPCFLVEPFEAGGLNTVQFLTNSTSVVTYLSCSPTRINRSRVSGAIGLLAILRTVNPRSIMNATYPDGLAPAVLMPHGQNSETIAHSRSSALRPPRQTRGS